MPRSHLTFPSCPDGPGIAPRDAFDPGTAWAGQHQPRAPERGDCRGPPDPAGPLSPGPNLGPSAPRPSQPPGPAAPGPSARSYRSSWIPRPPGPTTHPYQSPRSSRAHSTPIPELPGPTDPGYTTPRTAAPGPRSPPYRSSCGAAASRPRRPGTAPPLGSDGPAAPAPWPGAGPRPRGVRRPAG